ncbi:DUF5696 domain-containing protein [Paenibacillus humicola]|uniref:DUF5696 domain-containing protein n=1 Tax=Paenibacillus humicola TaxID=3110540 RepID=UPI00237BE88C|nr:DUF5696 domain-containing protein [Paenibacillus humicola]
MFNKRKWLPALVCSAAAVLLTGGSIVRVYGGSVSDARPFRAAALTAEAGTAAKTAQTSAAPGAGEQPSAADAVSAAGAEAAANAIAAAGWNANAAPELNSNAAAGMNANPGSAKAQASEAAGTQDEQLLFRSNAFTMPEDAVQNVPPAAIRPGYDKIADDGGLALYMNRKTLAIQVQLKATGYVWSSEPDRSDLQKEELNDDWRNAMLSPFILDYYMEDATRVSSNYKSLHGKVTAMKPIANGMEIACELPDIRTKLTVRVKLDKGSLVITLPNGSIEEQGSSRLASIQLYPFLGAVRQASVPGYLFVPDGSGALIRFADNHTQYDEPYVGQIYGSDIAVTDLAGVGNVVQYPIFGIVRGVKHNAMMGIVEDGKTNADIVAYPSGVNTNFYWISARFNIRYGYFQPTSQTMGGINTFTQAKTEGDKQVRYRLLSGAQADYAGMARAYRGYLEERGMMPDKRAATPGEDVPVQVALLGGDIEPGVLGSHVVKMTTFADAQAILADLRKAGVHNIEAVLEGWSKDGMNGARPPAPGFAGGLGGPGGFKRLIDFAGREGIGLYLYADYTNLLSGSPRVDTRGDAVRMITGRLIEYPYVSKYVSDLFKDMKGYYLSPYTALKLARNDFQAFAGEGVRAVALAGAGSELFSDYHKGKTINRTEAASLYGKLADEASGRSIRLALYEPNDYMLRAAGAYFGMPVESMQYMYESDTVPFVPMVLHGFVDYFADYANNDADPELDLLRLIDYGASPSFIVTKEPASKLQNTPSGELFTSAYADWAPEIKRQYDEVNAVLKKVRGAAMTGRTVVRYGVVKVSYDNGVDVWVNYTGSDYSDGRITVKAKSALAAGGGRS